LEAAAFDIDRKIHGNGYRVPGVFGYLIGRRVNRLHLSGIVVAREPFALVNTHLHFYTTRDRMDRIKPVKEVLSSVINHSPKSGALAQAALKQAA
jgi:hypothetical protein